MIYKISNEYITLNIDNHGAEAIALNCEGTEILRKRDAVWNRTAPIIFPIVGGLKDKYTYINGVKYQMRNHGFLRDHDFELYSLENKKIVLVDKWNKETLKVFPFKYEAYVTYQLIGKNAKTTIEIKNVDKVEYFYNIGGHPGFNCPFYEEESFEDYKIVFNKKETFAAPSYVNDLWDFSNPYVSFENIDHIALDYKYFEVDALVIKDIKSNEVSLLNKNNHGISFTWEGFNTLAFWTKPKNKYLCFEPWKGYDDTVDSNHNFLEKADLINIKPGEVKYVSYNIEIK